MVGWLRRKIRMIGCLRHATVSAVDVRARKIVAVRMIRLDAAPERAACPTLRCRGRTGRFAGRPARRTASIRCGGTGTGATVVAEIGNVPARALELKPRGGHLLHQSRLAALGAIDEYRIRHLLQSFMRLAASAAGVYVNRHRTSRLIQNPTCYFTARVETWRPRRPCFRTTRRHHARSGHSYCKSMTKR